MTTTSLFRILPALAVTVSTACASSSADQTMTTAPVVDSPQTPPATDPPTSPASPQDIAKGSNAFAMDLHAQLRSRDGNFAYSPASISVALAMTYAGAKGETAAQMRDAMHFGDDADALHAAYGSQLAAWNEPGRTAYELAVVNRLFGEKTATFEQPFLALTDTTYHAPLEPVDFLGAADASRVRINDWVAKQTKDRIKDLLPSGSLDSDTRLVLTNAVYFKGTWKYEFSKKATADAKFHNLAGADVTVPMMNLAADLKHASVDGVQVLELPYAGDQLAMDIFLPTDRDGLAALEQKMSGDNVDKWLGALSSREVEVAMPRFKIDPPKAVALKSTLTSMGMSLPFTKAADFSAMSPEKPLYIDDVFHKAFVEVNEKGTEAAAATAVVMRTESASVGPGPVSFRADHPFVFAIRDLQSGSLLFVGRVADPSKK